MTKLIYIIILLLILISTLFINQYENFNDKIVWNTKLPDYLTTLYKPIYTYVFYNAYHRDIIIHRNFTIGYYSLDGTIVNISSSLVIPRSNTIIYPNSKITNMFNSIENRYPLPSQKSESQFSIYTGNSTPIDRKWNWFFDNAFKRQHFGNWLYYCNSFCDYMTRDMFEFNPIVYQNFEEMFKEFLQGKIDFFISPINDFIKNEKSFSFLYSKVSLLGYLEPMIFTNDDNDNKKINIYKKYSFYNEYFDNYLFNKLKYNRNKSKLYYENELFCFDNYPQNIDVFGVLKLSKINKPNSVPFYLFSHSPNSKYAQQIYKNLMEKIFKIVEHQKNNYLNIVTNNLHQTEY